MSTPEELLDADERALLHELERSGPHVVEAEQPTRRRGRTAAQRTDPLDPVFRSEDDAAQR